jgi:glycosyltransferase involved in cell wall biosynthesis
MSVRAPRDDVMVIPAYNEAGAIAETLGSLSGLSLRIVVVDDGSTDDTTRRAHEAGATVLRHSCNLSQGAALQTGLTYALTQPETRFVVTFDADGQHAAADIGRMLEPSSGVSRRHSGLAFRGNRDDPRDPRQPSARAPARGRTHAHHDGLSHGHSQRSAGVHRGSRVSDLARRIMAHAGDLVADCRANFDTVRSRRSSVTPPIAAKAQTLSNGVNILWEILMERMG